MQTLLKSNFSMIFFFKRMNGWVLLFSILLITSCKKEIQAPEPDPANLQVTQAKGSISMPATVTPFYTGLNNPRGLKFGPDGNLYVAEGGTGGSYSSVGACQQVPFPVGPYLGGTTSGRISKISPAGIRTTITDQFPSSQANEIIGGDVSGVGDIAFVGNTLYAVLAGAGCSHGVPSVPNGVFRRNSNGSWTMIANLSAWLQAHPVQHPEEDDFEPDGTPYSMINVRGDLYVIEPNHGDFIKVTTGGNISRVVDISASQGHIVPTTLAYHGNFFVGNLHPFPIVEGSSKIMKISPDGHLEDWITGLTTVLGLVIDQGNTMYVLENTVGAPFPTPGLGRVIKVDRSGTKEIIASGLSLPTAMTMGPDGNLYVSNWGFSPHAIGGGEVVKITLHN